MDTDEEPSGLSLSSETETGGISSSILCVVVGLKTKDRMKSLGIDVQEVGKHLGKQQGLILRELVEITGLKRVCVAGGDTCSYVLRQMDIHSLELLMPITPAAPLCRAFSDHSPFEGLQVASKGGQIGAPEYFIQVLDGQRANL